MTLKELSGLTGIPYQTLLGWNSSKGDYRKSLVRFLKDADRSALIKYFGHKERVETNNERHRQTPSSHNRNNS
ncbi:hypothetical protein [Campylobacter sp.]|uniref:hypothetical protein n=1 Tax=Campylobacter sp. TaxID=205 RepID=UPI00290618FF|nr:hypothetical protein [Campylobacter sp.]MDU6827730.1 hypothetical protein [Campylobacter sp.]